MKSIILSSVFATGLFLALGTSNAQADSLSDCGNIDVNLDANCQVMAEGGCVIEDQCTLLACSASAYATCKPECTELPSVTCTGSCQTDCEASCTADASFDCSGNCSVRCEGDCSADCTAQCSADTDRTTCQSQCEGTCKASCQGDCNASCKGKASGDCTAKCTGSCNGSCSVKANLACHANCSGSAKATCKSDCEIACTKPKAAVFCDEQFVDVNGNYSSCIKAIEDWVTANVELDAKADGSAACNNGTCKAEGSASASASCAMAKVPNGSSWFGLGLLGVVTTGLVLRRRQRRGA